MTTKTKFTPGPWEVDRGLTRSGKNIVTRAVDGDGPYLIECPGSGGAMSLSETVCALHWTGTPEWGANAALIAAAPEMYEALKDAANSAGFQYMLGELRDRIDAALAKAEGRS